MCYFVDAVGGHWDLKCEPSKELYRMLLRLVPARAEAVTSRRLSQFGPP